jgi:hypothetical protein
MLHLLNKSAFIILLETVDSLRYFVLLFSSLYYILLQDMRRRSTRITQVLRSIQLTILDASLHPFYGLLCSNPLLYYLENYNHIDVCFISWLVIIITMFRLTYFYVVCLCAVCGTYF